MKYLLLPPGVFVLLVVFGLMLRTRWPRFSVWVAGGAAAGLYVASTPIAVDLIFMPLERHDALAIEDVASGANDVAADAVVVLSAEMRATGGEYGEAEWTVGDLTLARVRYAAYLARRAGAPVLATGGGAKRERPPVGALMADVLENEFETPARWVERRSRNTQENATYSYEILSAEGISRIYLVTHAWHMPRAVYVFEKAGFEVVPAPTDFTTARSFVDGPVISDFLPSPRAMRHVYYAAHEYVGLAWYRLRY